MHLPGQPEDALPPQPEVLQEGVMLMSTYEEFMVILAVVGLIVEILKMKNKK